MGANLNRARIMDLTNLAGANLSGSLKIDPETGQSKYLESAIMPNGQKYEDWLNDKEDREKD
jgi:hypothetical protein